MKVDLSRKIDIALDRETLPNNFSLGSKAVMWTRKLSSKLRESASLNLWVFLFYKTEYILELSRVFLYYDLHSFLHAILMPLAKWYYSSTHCILTSAHTFISAGHFCAIFGAKISLGVHLLFGFIRIRDFAFDLQFASNIKV